MPSLPNTLIYIQRRPGSPHRKPIPPRCKFIKMVKLKSLLYDGEEEQEGNEENISNTSEAEDIENTSNICY